jgi:PAS domain S-box-containing protein
VTLYGQIQMLSTRASRILDRSVPPVPSLFLKARNLRDVEKAQSENSQGEVPYLAFAPLLSRSFWIEHTSYSVPAILFVLAEAALIIVLLVERRRRKRAQAAIARRFAIERVVAELSTGLSDCAAQNVIGEIERGLGLILEAEEADQVCWFAVPDGGTVMEKVCSVQRRGVSASPDRLQSEDVPWIAEGLFHRSAIAINRTEDLPPEAERDRQYLEQLGIKSIALLPTKAGTSVTGLLIVVHISRQRDWPRALIERLGVLGNLFGNALSRKQAQDSKKTSEDLFRALFQQASLGIALEDWTGRILFANPALCKMLGREEAEMQQMTCDQVADSEDSREDAECFEKLRAGLIEAYRIEKRYVRPNGTKMWGNLNVSALRASADGSTRVIAMVEDITESKAAANQLQKIQIDLQQLTARLIKAQEGERQRISRELHDDIGQRLSLLVIGMEQLNHNLPVSAQDQLPELSQLRNQAEDLVSDVHELSHELHSTKLQHLGLKAALYELCRKISAQKSIAVDFQVSDLPHFAPETQLCLYRVAQEALNNILKHSGTDRVTVSLRVNGEKGQLQIKDTGVGFNVEEASNGLGLASMRERLRIVGGVLSVRSIPGQGTEIIAEVPLTPLENLAQAS